MDSCRGLRSITLRLIHQHRGQYLRTHGHEEGVGYESRLPAEISVEDGVTVLMNGKVPEPSSNFKVQQY